MVYANYNSNLYGVTTVYGSRSSAQVYPGAICPQEASFGRVHGASPATGEIKFRGIASVPAAQVITINIGSAVFHGLATKVETDISNQHGASTRIRVVDMRDRLHDVNHFAQYNMIDDTGRWWHILPINWTTQIRKYVKKMQTVADFSDTQTVMSNINTLTGAPPALSAYNILLNLARTYGFTLSGTDEAIKKLKKHYPENLDWNSGRKVAECIEEVLSKDNMQWTCWGNLVVHITEKGVPSNALEQAILSGNVNLCNLGNFTEAALGNEISEKSRRVRITGGRNRYELYFPCLPDWNPNFTAELCDSGWEASELFQKLNLNAFNRLQDMPGIYQDKENRGGVSVENKHGDKLRGKMSIKDYIDNMCFKAYRIDFNTPLKLRDDNLPFKVPLQHLNFDLLSGISSRVAGPFNYDAWLNARAGVKESTALDTLYPISQNLPSDSNRQIICNATTRAMHIKGLRTADQFLKGEFAYITDGVSLEVENYVINAPNAGAFQVYNAREFWRGTVMFAEKRIRGNAREGFDGEGKPTTFYDFFPDQVYCRISVDREMYAYVIGEAPTAPRVRERIVNYNNLFKSFIFGVEQSLLTQNFLSTGFSNGVKANDIAGQLAQRALNHEFITTAGNIKFRTQAGFMCSGVIESVMTAFSSSTGTNETINFTNVRNDERAVLFQPTLTRSKFWNKGEEEMRREALREEAKTLARELNKNAQAGGGIAAKANIESTVDRAHMAQIFGEKDQAIVQIKTTDNIPDGEIMLVGESTAKRAMST